MLTYFIYSSIEMKHLFFRIFDDYGELFKWLEKIILLQFYKIRYDYLT